MHIADFSIGILGANGVVAGGLPLSAGAGLSIKLRKTDQVVVCFFGDAPATGTGPRGHEHGSIWKLPIIFCVENNCGPHHPTSYSCSVTQLAKRAAGYNMPGVTVDGNDILAVRAAAREAVSRARAGEGPTFLENQTYRIRGHFEGDPQRYRQQAEVKTWQEKNDPITRFAELLTKKKVLSAKLQKDIWDRAEAELKEAVAFAEASPYPEPEEALDDLLANA